MKLLIFGIGKYYHARSDMLFETLGDDVLAGFVDNRAREIPAFKGRRVYLPSELYSVDFDLILPMSVDYCGMKKELLKNGIIESQICDWEHYISAKCRGKVKIYTPRSYQPPERKRVLIICPNTGYHGNSHSALYAARSLSKRGHDISIATTEIEAGFLQEYLSSGIAVIVAPSLECPSDAELYWIGMFDFVIVNTALMVCCACEISKILSTLWWLHEGFGINAAGYNSLRAKFPNHFRTEAMRDTGVFAVSRIAKHAFETFCPGGNLGILPYGIPDDSVSPGECGDFGHPFVFAVIGRLVRIKAQTLFLQAAMLLPQDLREQTEF